MKTVITSSGLWFIELRVGDHWDNVTNMNHRDHIQCYPTRQLARAEMKYLKSLYPNEKYRLVRMTDAQYTEATK
jgi:hypothetical protein